MESNERKDVYAIVTDHIIAQLEKGVVPWQKPWGEAGIPQNLITGREYRGINIMLLNSLGYSQNMFLSFKQAKSIGATIKRGEKAHLVVFWKMVDKKNETNVPDAEENNKVPMLRYYMVFNVEQCVGIPTDKLPPVIEKPAIEPINACEAILEGYPIPPKVRHGDTEAYYAPAFDLISMPHKERFTIQEEYYSTLFHELVHSTGHESRLNRPSLTQETKHGSELYSFEELIAEVGTCFLCSHGGISNQVFQNSAAYIGGWLKRLKGEKRWLFMLLPKHKRQLITFLMSRTMKKPTRQRKMKVYYRGIKSRMFPVIHLQGNYLSEYGFSIGDDIMVQARKGSITITKA